MGGLIAIECDLLMLCTMVCIVGFFFFPNEKEGLFEETNVRRSIITNKLDILKVKIITISNSINFVSREARHGLAELARAGWYVDL